eukprot:714928_1
MCTEEAKERRWCIIFGIVITVFDSITDVLFGIQYLVIQCGPYDYIYREFRTAALVLIVVSGVGFLLGLCHYIAMMECECCTTFQFECGYRIDLFDQTYDDFLLGLKFWKVLIEDLISCIIVIWFMMSFGVDIYGIASLSFSITILFKNMAQCVWRFCEREISWMLFCGCSAIVTIAIVVLLAISCIRPSSVRAKTSISYGISHVNTCLKKDNEEGEHCWPKDNGPVNACCEMCIDNGTWSCEQGKYYPLNTCDDFGSCVYTCSPKDVLINPLALLMF